jgi:3-methyladenine DNA glycosylase AlkD
MTFEEIRKKVSNLANEDKAKVLKRFFKTGPGQYGENDIFLGITVPVLRNITKECRNTSINDIMRLLQSSIHEERVLALFLLVGAYTRGGDAVKKKIYSLYLKNTRYINNWDLVDLSAPNILGHHLRDKGRKQLYKLATSKDLWKKRIAILATLTFIRQHDFTDTLNISQLLLSDEHDLIHKAVGWMLREVGKRDLQSEEKFLKRHYRIMPRTMLRYAIERFPERKRKKYLEGKM